MLLLCLGLEGVPLILLITLILLVGLELFKFFVDFGRVEVVVNADLNDGVRVENFHVLACILGLLVYDLHLVFVEFDFHDLLVVRPGHSSLVV